MVVAVGNLLSDRYRIDQQIGKGSFAQVFSATDARLKRRVAVKVLDPALTAQPDYRGRFEREAQRVAELEHPNILSIFDYGEADSSIFLVMPFIDGGTLAEKLRRQGRLSLQEAGDYLEQAASALDFAHERNIVHGDVKPQNMLLGDDGKRLLLADFGFAKALSAPAAAQVQSGGMGNTAYMAPEQFQGNVGPASDIYALGCIVFEMLTGTTPFTGSPDQVMYGQVMGAPPSIVERSHGQLPEALQIVIEIALARLPEDRFKSAGELVAAIREASASPVLSGSGSVAPPPPGMGDIQARATQVAAEPLPPQLVVTDGRAIAPTQGVLIAPPPQEIIAPFEPTVDQILAARSWGWKIAQSWWVVVPFLTLALLSWLVFGYIGVRARRIRWLLWGLVYFVAVTLVLVFSDTSFSAWMALVTWVGSSGHAFVVALAYLRRLAVMQARPERRGWIF
jgi:eukaryotic-like serine/threonine-protein kinase